MLTLLKKSKMFNKEINLLTSYIKLQLLNWNDVYQSK